MVSGGEHAEAAEQASSVVRLATEENGDKRPSLLTTVRYALETYWLPPGVYAVDVEIMDDGASWRPAYAESVEILPGESLVLYYDEETDRFIAR